MSMSFGFDCVPRGSVYFPSLKIVPKWYGAQSVPVYFHIRQWARCSEWPINLLILKLWYFIPFEEYITHHAPENVTSDPRKTTCGQDKSGRNMASYITSCTQSSTLGLSSVKQIGGLRWSDWLVELSIRWPANHSLTAALRTILFSTDTNSCASQCKGHLSHPSIIVWYPSSVLSSLLSFPM